MDNAISETKDWISNFIIRLDICPFAKIPFQAERILFVTSSHTELQECLGDCYNMIIHMREVEKTIVSNAFLIFNKKCEFDFMLDLQSVCEELLIELDLDDDFQIVVFHPHYQFEGEGFHASSNYTNRSPYPMLHFLRKDEVASAIRHHKDVNSIPQRNINLLNSLKIQNIKDLYTTDFIKKSAAMFEIIDKEKTK